MTLLTVPVIDLTSFRDGMDKAGNADPTCLGIGSLVISGHGVPTGSV